MDLFESSISSESEPLASRMRPRTLDEYVGQEHILGKGRLLRRAIQLDQLSSIIFYGPPGTGKTTLAKVIANTTKSHFSTLNAVLAGLKELEVEINAAKERRSLHGIKTILFIDEVHRWNKRQQDALSPFRHLQTKREDMEDSKYHSRKVRLSILWMSQEEMQEVFSTHSSLQSRHPSSHFLLRMALRYTSQKKPQRNPYRRRLCFMTRKGTTISM